MNIEWVGNKANIASSKHFNGALTEEQMTQLAKKVINNKTHIGKSNRANPGHDAAYIVWGEYNGDTYAILADSKKIKEGIILIVSFYDVHNVDYKAVKYNMKPVKKG